MNDIINELLKKYGTNNPFELCTYLDIHIVKEDLGKQIYGYLQRLDDNLVIIHINNTIPYHLQKYSCAHELGHALLQPDLSIGFFIENPLLVKNKAEIEADKFAAELLIQKEDIDDHFLKNMSLDQVSSFLGLPRELVEYKFIKK